MLCILHPSKSYVYEFVPICATIINETCIISFNSYYVSLLFFPSFLFSSHFLAYTISPRFISLFYASSILAVLCLVCNFFFLSPLHSNSHSLICASSHLSQAHIFTSIFLRFIDIISHPSVPVPHRPHSPSVAHTTKQ